MVPLCILFSVPGAPLKPVQPAQDLQGEIITGNDTLVYSGQSSVRLPDK